MTKTLVTQNEVAEGGLVPKNITSKNYSASSAGVTLSTSWQDIATITINAADLPGTGNYNVLVIGNIMSNQAGNAGQQEVYAGVKVDSAAEVGVAFQTTVTGTYFTQVITSIVVAVSANATHTIKLRSQKGGAISAVVNASSFVQAIILSKV